MEQTRLGAALAAKDLPATSAGSAFSASLAGARVCEQFEIRLPNGVAVTCGLTLLGGEALLVIESEVRRRMVELAIPLDITTQGDFEFLRARAILARAALVWDPSKGADAPPLGTPEQWGSVVPESVQAAYRRFNELREQHDPLADDVRLDDLEILEIRSAIEKKNLAVLRTFGLQRLSAFLLITVSPPADSATPKSEPGDSQQES